MCKGPYKYKRSKYQKQGTTFKYYFCKEFILLELNLVLDFPPLTEKVVKDLLSIKTNGATNCIKTLFL